MKTIQRLTCVLLLVVMSGCATVKPNQKWPILPEHQRPDVPQVSRVPLLEAIDEMEPGELREKIRRLAVGATDDLVEAWQDFTFWGDKMDTAIREYNEKARRHNKKVD